MMALSARKRSWSAFPEARVGGEWVAYATALLALVALLAVIPARAQDDLPGRVGRVADIAGELYLAPPDPGADWAAIGNNYTVTTGDNLWVPGDGRAEVDYGGGQFRIAGGTNLNVVRLDDQALTLFVAQGRVNLRVRFLEGGEISEVDAPNAQVQFTRPGSYRVEVTDERRLTMVTVREGAASVYLAAGVRVVLPGQTAYIRGEDPGDAEIRDGYYSDVFDAWSEDRDRRYEASASARYVSPQMVGYADLDQYGTWQPYPEYGAVWFPTAVSAGWAPYRVGRWAWVGGWGWTWVDDAPWGYAPFHYGRWVYVGSRWGWVPGGYVARPVWAPAMVAWYGGSGWSLSATVGGPAYGWVPLGWREPYIPAWRNCSNRCWSHYNRPYAVPYNDRPRVPPSQYVNQRAPGGFTAVSGSTMMAGRPVWQNTLQVGGAVEAPLLHSAPVAMRPSPGRIPGARPGPSTGAAPPASTFYPSARPSRAPAPEAPVARPAPVQQAPSGRTSPVTAPGSQPSVRTPPTSVSGDAVPARRPSGATGTPAHGEAPARAPGTGATAVPPASRPVPPGYGAPAAAAARSAPTAAPAPPPGRVAPLPSATPGHVAPVPRSAPPAAVPVPAAPAGSMPARGAPVAAPPPQPMPVAPAPRGAPAPGAQPPGRMAPGPSPEAPIPSR